MLFHVSHPSSVACTSVCCICCTLGSLLPVCQRADVGSRDCSAHTSDALPCFFHPRPDATGSPHLRRRTERHPTHTVSVEWCGYSRLPASIARSEGTDLTCSDVWGCCRVCRCVWERGTTPVHCAHCMCVLRGVCAVRCCSGVPPLAAGIRVPRPAVIRPHRTAERCIPHLSHPQNTLNSAIKASAAANVKVLRALTVSGGRAARRSAASTRREALAHIDHAHGQTSVYTARHSLRAVQHGVECVSDRPQSSVGGRLDGSQ